MSHKRGSHENFAVYIDLINENTIFKCSVGPRRVPPIIKKVLFSDHRVYLLSIAIEWMQLIFLSTHTDSSD